MNCIVSVIITTHKRDPEILKRAIDSALYQTYKNIQIIVVDDAPDYERHEEIVELIDSYGEAVQYHINTRKTGACASRNDGIKMSIGDYIALLDDDDAWLPQKLELLIPLIKDNVGLAYGKFETINAKGNIYIQHPRKSYSGMICDELFLYGNFIGGCSVPVMLKKSVIDVGMFDEELQSAQDYDLWIRVAKKYEVAYKNEVVVNYYISKDAISSSPMRKLISREYLLQKYASDYKRLPAAQNRVVSDAIYCLFASGNIKEAKAYYKSNKCISLRQYVSLNLKGRIKHMLLRVKIQNR